MKKRILSIVLSIVILVSLLPTTVLAAHSSHSGMTAWTSSTSLPSKGDYYLTTNVTVSSSQTISQGTLNLSLSSRSM